MSLERSAALNFRVLQTRRRLRPKTTLAVADPTRLRLSDRDPVRRPLVEVPFLERLCMITLICVIEECYI